MLGQVFKAPSYGTLSGIQVAVSNRKTANGWNVWKFKGKTLKVIRAKYFKITRKKRSAINSLHKVCKAEDEADVIKANLRIVRLYYIA